MDRHKKIQVTNTQIYVCVYVCVSDVCKHVGVCVFACVYVSVCVCVFLYSMKERAVTGINMATRSGGSEGWAPLSKAATQSLSPPLPLVTRSNKKKQKQSPKG